MNFKVGDKVRRTDPCMVDFGGTELNVIYAIESFDGVNLTLEGVRGHYNHNKFTKVETSLETELRLCESRKGILCKRIGEDQEEKKSLEKRIQELQQAIKERDKPKGRVGLKDALDTGEAMYAISGDGKVWGLSSPRSRAEYRLLGNLFYDKESAERTVHDRKQRVLRGEDV